jgi:hypothetical protein
VAQCVFTVSLLARQLQRSMRSANLLAEDHSGHSGSSMVRPNCLIKDHSGHSNSSMVRPNCLILYLPVAESQRFAFFIVLKSSPINLAVIKRKRKEVSTRWSLISVVPVQ